jgi:phage terminase large subunit GpA-like protein
MSTTAPSFTIPSGEKIGIRIINTTSLIKIPIVPFMGPPMTGYTHLNAPAYSFLIEHSSGRKLLFDLGVKKDWQNMAGPAVEGIKHVGAEVTVEKNVVEILEDNGIKGEEIEAIIWR